MPDSVNKLNGQVYEFGQFRLDVAERQLLREGEPVRLTPKVFDLLVVLVEAGGRLVEKEELMARVWPDSYVEEGNINRNVSTLRRALDGDGGEECIETVPKRGYRFIAPVRAVARDEEIVVQRRIETRIVAAEEIIEAEPEAAPLPQPGFDQRQLSFPKPTINFRWKSRWKSWMLAGLLVAIAIIGLLWLRRERTLAEPVKSIAVLPFKFLGADRGDEYLALGMTDTLITRLASLRQLSVRPTSAVLKYQKEGQDVIAAGKALRVDAVLDGYVQKFGETVGVRLQLIRVTDGALLWSGESVRQSADILSLHDSVTTQLAQALAVKLSDEQRRQLSRRYRDNAEAYRAYLKGRYFWNRRGADWRKKAMEAFERAIALDPNYALAYAGLADAHIILGDHGLIPPKEVFPKAKEAAVKALELDESLAEAHTALAQVNFRFDWDFAAAEWEYKRAIELDPGYALAYGWYSGMLRNLGRFDEALAAVKRAQELEPLLPNLYVYGATAYIGAGQPDQAIEQSRKALEIDPGFWTATYHLGRAYAAYGMWEEAIAELEKAASFAADNPGLRSHLAYALAAAGRRQEALKILNELQELSARRYIRHYQIGLIHAGLGEHQQALDWFQKALEDRDPFMTNLAFDPWLDPLRSNPRFTELQRRVGLPLKEK
jgi:DNA-binding winged helix-turn-helix (wHTH) protein/tetratricopeptide (TPR) repeat protein